MNDEGTLFGLGDDTSADQSDAPPTPIQRFQIDQIRKALDATSATTMVDRQRLIEQFVGRNFPVLRDLYFEDVRPLLEGLHRRMVANPESSGSAWDQRDEDAWIDRL